MQERTKTTPRDGPEGLQPLAISLAGIVRRPLPGSVQLTLPQPALGYSSNPNLLSSWLLTA